MTDRLENSTAREIFASVVSKQVSAFASCRVVRLLESRALTLRHYHTVLLTIFHQSWHGPYNMALAAANCSWRHGRAKEFLLEHAAQEAGHWRWIIEDLQATGYSGPDPTACAPHESCAAYVGFAEWISREAPYARLATNSVLEGIAAQFGADYGRKLIEHLGIGRDQAKFFLNHAVTDREHIVEIGAIVGETQFSTSEWKWMNDTAELAGRFYRGMYDHSGYEVG